MWRARAWLLSAVVGTLVVVPAAAQEGRWTLRLQAGGVRGSGESISVYNGLATEECLRFEVLGHCWVTNRYLLEEDHPLAGLALAYRVTPQWGVEATVWRGSTLLRAEREGWPCSGVDCGEPYQIARDDIGLTGADLSAVFHIPGPGQVDVYGGLLVGWVWADEAHLYGLDQGFYDQPREVRGGLEYGALAGADVVLGGGAWRAGLQVRQTWNSLEVEEIDPLHSDWADLDARLMAVQLTLGYTF
jgi:hypothetical protein